MKLGELEALRARLALHDAEAAFHAIPRLLAEREMLLDALRALARAARIGEHGAALAGSQYWITPEAVYRPAEAALRSVDEEPATKTIVLQR